MFSDKLSESVILFVIAQVLGLGPTFKIRVELQNTSTGTPSLGLVVVFHADHHVYDVKSSVIQVTLGSWAGVGRGNTL